MADSVDHDQISAFGMSYQGLHCFLRLPVSIPRILLWYFIVFQVKGTDSRYQKILRYCSSSTV